MIDYSLEVDVFRITWPLKVWEITDNVSEMAQERDSYTVED